MSAVRYKSWTWVQLHRRSNWEALDAWHNYHKASLILHYSSCMLVIWQEMLTLWLSLKRSTDFKCLMQGPILCCFKWQRSVAVSICVDRVIRRDSPFYFKMTLKDLMSNWTSPVPRVQQYSLSYKQSLLSITLLKLLSCAHAWLDIHYVKQDTLYINPY